MPETVLLVDDDEATLRVLELLLSRRGFEVVKAQTAEEGLRKAYRFQPDVVLLDINMPSMDGYEMCRRLREMSDVPIIFLTALSNTEEVVHGLEVGADDFVTKPWDSDELIARIKAHLRRAPRAPSNEELVFDHLLELMPSMVALQTSYYALYEWLAGVAQRVRLAF